MRPYVVTLMSPPTQTTLLSTLNVRELSTSIASDISCTGSLPLIRVPTTGSAGAASGRSSCIFADLRIAFVDDELPNCRLGRRMLTKLGIAPENIIFLHDGSYIKLFFSGSYHN